MHAAKYLVELGSIFPKGCDFSVSAEGGFSEVEAVDGILEPFLSLTKLTFRGQ